MAKEMSTQALTNDIIEADIQAILKYNSILESEVKLMREDRSFQELSHEAWKKHTDSVLEEVKEQTRIMQDMLVCITHYTNR